MIKLIVGLGNVGAAYENTRHNAGFWFVQALADKEQAHLALDKKFFGTVGRTVLNGQEIRLLLPATMMNLSGQAVAAVAKFYGVAANQILVVHDELDIALGAVRLKTGGGHGGHNGLRDIAKHIGNDFHRLRLGIGRGTHGDVSSFVLGKPSTDEKIAIDRAIDEALVWIDEIVAGNLEPARQALHSL